jgi:hypothetical protein
MVFRNAQPARHDGDMLLKRIRRWLGWESDSSWLDFGERPGRDKPKPSALPKLPVQPAAARPGEPSRPPRVERRQKPRGPLDVLDNPKLSLDKPADDGFDPYNTGAFNRSASWDKIGRQRKR